jgi:hypothetical protein
MCMIGTQVRIGNASATFTSMSAATEGRDAQQKTYTRWAENRDEVMGARTPHSRRGLEHDRVKPQARIVTRHWGPPRAC